jgi:hypothetical protein
MLESTVAATLFFDLVELNNEAVSIIREIF